MKQFWQTTMNPSWYHGHGRKPPFFEGWYYKLIDLSTNNKYAIIPGVFLSQNPHAFIQILNGSNGQSHYHTYPIETFWAANDKFEVHIDSNRFTADTIHLNINQLEKTAQGTIQFVGLSPWPVTVTAPGIMGWYAWVPFMECYHGVVSLDHSIRGSLEFNGNGIDFTGGRGYIEKDWGRSFPSAWIWLQTNHFNHPETSLTGSIAMIPWVRQAFRGFIIGFWHEQQLFRFATYTGAVTEKLTMTDNQIDWVVRDKKFRLEMQTTRGEAGLLKGPTTIDMGKRVAETLNATITVILSRFQRGRPKILFSGIGRHAGLEVFNAQEGIISSE